MTTEFKRELRYAVFKIKDIQSYLSPLEQEMTWDFLNTVGSAINTGRAAEGKLPFNALVIEQDWPEFDVAWEMIETRMKKEQP